MLGNQQSLKLHSVAKTNEENGRLLILYCLFYNIVEENKSPRTRMQYVIYINMAKIQLYNTL